MRWILCTAIALTGMGITGCVSDDEDRPVVIEREPQVIHHHKETVREQPVVVEKRSDPVVIEKHTSPAPAPKVEINNNVDR